MTAYDMRISDWSSDVCSSDLDSCHLLHERSFPTQILVDQGDADPFLDEQLQTWRLVAVLKETGQSAKVRMQPGYDHSYFFIATFIDDHLRHHARILRSEEHTSELQSLMRISYADF